MSWFWSEKQLPGPFCHWSYKEFYHYSQLLPAWLHRQHRLWRIFWAGGWKRVCRFCGVTFWSLFCVFCVTLSAVGSFCWAIKRGWCCWGAFLLRRSSSGVKEVLAWSLRVRVRTRSKLKPIVRGVIAGCGIMFLGFIKRVQYVVKWAGLMILSLFMVWARILGFD